MEITSLFWHLSIIDNIRLTRSKEITHRQLISKMIANSFNLLITSKYSNYDNEYFVIKMKEICESEKFTFSSVESITKQIMDTQHLRNNLKNIFEIIRIDNIEKYYIDEDLMLTINDDWFIEITQNPYLALQKYRTKIIDYLNNQFPQNPININHLVGGVATSKLSFFDKLFQNDYNRHNLCFPNSFLWELKVTDDEYSELKALLKSVISQNKELNNFSREFALYYAEWFRRECVDLGSKGNDIKSSLDFDELQRYAEKGFEKLGKQYIFLETTRKQSSLFLEGGLPLNYIVNCQNTHVGLAGFFIRFCAKKTIDENDMQYLSQSAKKSSSIEAFSNKIIKALESDNDNDFPFSKNEDWENVIKKGWEQTEKDRANNPLKIDWLFDHSAKQFFVEIKCNNRISKDYLKQVGVSESDFISIDLIIDDVIQNICIYQHQPARGDYYTQYNKKQLAYNIGDVFSIQLNGNEISSDFLDMGTPQIFHKAAGENFYRLGNKMKVFPSIILYSGHWVIDYSNINYFPNDNNLSFKAISFDSQSLDDNSRIEFKEDTSGNIIEFKFTTSQYTTRYKRLNERNNGITSYNIYAYNSIIFGKDDLTRPYGLLTRENDKDNNEVEKIIVLNQVEFREIGSNKWEALTPQTILPIGEILLRVVRFGYVSNAVKLINLGSDFKLEYQDVKLDSCRLKICINRKLITNDVQRSNERYSNITYYNNNSIKISPKFMGVNIANIYTKQPIANNTIIPLAKLNDYRCDIVSELPLIFKINSIDINKAATFPIIGQTAYLGDLLGIHIKDMSNKSPLNIVQNRGVEIEIDDFKFKVMEWPYRFDFQTQEENRLVVSFKYYDGNIMELYDINLLAIPIDNGNENIHFKSGMEIELNGKYIIISNHPGVLPKLYFNEKISETRQDIINNIVSQFENSKSYKDTVWIETLRYYEVAINYNISITTFLHFEAIASSPILLSRFFGLIYLNNFLFLDLLNANQQEKEDKILFFCEKTENELTFKWHWIKNTEWDSLEDFLPENTIEGFNFYKRMIYFCSTRFIDTEINISFLENPEASRSIPFEEIKGNFIKLYDANSPIPLVAFTKENEHDKDFTLFAKGPFYFASTMNKNYKESILWSRDNEPLKICKNIIYLENNYPQVYFPLLETFVHSSIYNNN